MIVMQLPNIKGDCEITGYEDWIVVDSLSWEITREEKESGSKDRFHSPALHRTPPTCQPLSPPRIPPLCE